MVYLFYVLGIFLFFSCQHTLQRAAFTISAQPEMILMMAVKISHGERSAG
jgi:hypothetical protein